MAYLAFYRAFRPTDFNGVVRQEHIVRILKNQIETGKIGHAYLFCGPRGTGKTTLAKIFARAINCERPVDGSPCGECATCKALAKSSNLDVYEIDAASNNGVDEMRDLREKVQYPPVAGKYKVYIIDEVHMLTASAFNAVLKTLEEPPRHAVFILATTEPQKIPATILSRCMRFDFKLIAQKDLEELVKSVLEKSGKEYEDEAVSAIARAGAGSARDSLSIADMCASYSRGKLTYADVNAVLGGAEYAKVAHICASMLKEDMPAALSGVEEILAGGKSVGVLLKDMQSFLNDVTVAKVCRNPREILNLPDEMYSLIVPVAESADGHKLLRASEILGKAETDMRYSVNGRITLETAVIKCAVPQSDYNIDALIGRIDELEKRIEKLLAMPRTEIPAKSAETAQPQQPTRSAPGESVTAQPVQKTIEPEPTAPPAAPPAPKRAEPPVEKPVQPPAANRLMEEQSETNPFAAESGSPQRPATPPAQSGGAETAKTAVFAKLIKSLRTTHRNAVLFTLCMDLEPAFEGDVLVLLTDSEAVQKALSRADNAAFLQQILDGLGVKAHAVRLKTKQISDYDRALGELKNNFNGIDIEIK